MLCTISLNCSHSILLHSNKYNIVRRFSYIQNIIMENKLLSPTVVPERLSKQVYPINYNLRLNPNIERGTFEGNVEIQLEVEKESNYISLHSKDLDILKVTLFNNKEQILISKITELKNYEQIVINFDTNISMGRYNLSIKFSGSLTGSIVGFYSTQIKDRAMVSSKFEPTYARQAFPCFDEPDFKATYDIALVKPKSYIALSNMNEISSEHDASADTDLVTFATSVPMSSYLACFVICDFESKETDINSNGIGKNFILRSFAQKGQMNKIDFAQDIGKRATEFYINYYKVSFPLPKLDMIAIPNYISGATEHWGLVTYRETSFLIDEATASATNKINVANTIAHELAHMWFGNLVTMKWWDDIWLNEGFASYMQVKALDALEPSWNMLDNFVPKTLHPVLVIDSKLSSHPIVQTVSTPDQITAIFDAISYNKGASLLRMLEGFVGKENFQKGVTDYLKKYEFRNTVTQDFFDTLEPHFKKDVAEINITSVMDTWTKQMGYPVLDVQKGESPNTYIVTQKRFLINPDAAYDNDSKFNYRWSIPITYKTDKEVNDKILWFKYTADKVTITLEAPVKWLKINNDQVGYYRVNYPQEMWLELRKQLVSKAEELTISDRSHLLNDVFALAEARRVPYDLALNLTTYLSIEDQYVPWSTASSIFNQLSDRLRNSMACKNLLKYVQSLVKPLYDQQKWDRVPGLTTSQRLLRAHILSMATTFELPDATSNVRSLFLNWLERHGTNNATVIEPDLRHIIYYFGMKFVTAEEWEKVWQIYLKEEDAQEQSKLRKALAAPLNTKILQRYLTLAWEESNIRGQDYLTVLSYISDNPSGTELVWNHVRSRWSQFIQRFTLNSRYLGQLIPAATHSFNSEVRIKEMEAFFKEYPEAGAGELSRRRAMENVKNNMKWSQHYEPVVNKWLSQQSSILQ